MCVAKAKWTNSQTEFVAGAGPKEVSGVHRDAVPSSGLGSAPRGDVGGGILDLVVATMEVPLDTRFIVV